MTEEEVSQIAYFFVGDYEGMTSIGEYASSLVEGIKRWQSREDACMLADIVSDSMTTIFDTRGHPRILVLKGLLHEVLQECRSITSVDRICQAISESSCAYIKARYVGRALEILFDQGVVVREGDLYMGLTIPMHSAYQPAQEAFGRLKTLFSGTEDAGFAERASLESRQAVEVLSL